MRKTKGDNMDVSEIKEIAEGMKSNGGKGISNTDMNWYMLHKIDALGDKLDGLMSKEDCVTFRESVEKRQANKTTWFISILAIGLSTVAVITSLIINFN